MSERTHLKIIGLTGGIATGKSSVARLLAEQGFLVMDADQIVRDLSAPGGAAHAAILQRFGTADRTQLRGLVFKDATAKRDLESILHPLVQLESLERARKMTEHDPGKGPVIYEAALLIETGRDKDLDGLIVVTAPESLRRARLIVRDGCTEEIARTIIQEQLARLSDADRITHATHVVTNSGSLDDLKTQVADLAKLLTLAHNTTSR